MSSNYFYDTDDAFDSIAREPVNQWRPYIATPTIEAPPRRSRVRAAANAVGRGVRSAGSATVTAAKATGRGARKVGEVLGVFAFISLFVLMTYGVPVAACAVAAFAGWNYGAEACGAIASAATAAWSAIPPVAMDYTTPFRLALAPLIAAVVGFGFLWWGNDRHVDEANEKNLGRAGFEDLRERDPRWRWGRRVVVGGLVASAAFATAGTLNWALWVR